MSWLCSPHFSTWFFTIPKACLQCQPLSFPPYWWIPILIDFFNKKIYYYMVSQHLWKSLYVCILDHFIYMFVKTPSTYYVCILRLCWCKEAIAETCCYKAFVAGIELSSPHNTHHLCSNTFSYVNSYTSVRWKVWYFQFDSCL